MFEFIQIFALLVSFFPSGFACGVLTERLASRNVAATQLPRVWTTLVKCTVSWLVWRYLIFLRWPDGEGFGANCTLPVTSQWLDGGKGYEQDEVELERCTAMEGIKITSILILRCIFFSAAARLGSKLQPVGLTGSIACGKSTVSKLLRDPSTKVEKDAFTVIDVDAVAHNILVPGKMKSDCGYRRVVNAFYREDIFVDSDASDASSDPPIDRRKLGDIIFHNPTKRRVLNSITHPLISKIMMKQIILEGLSPTSKKTSIVSVDIPLLFEVGLKMRLLFGIKVVVACDEQVQLKRLMERNTDLTRDQCESRIKSQIPISKKVQMADVVIWNNGTMKDLLLNVEKARGEVLARSHAFGGITLAKGIAFAGMAAASSCLYDVIQLMNA